MRWAKITVAVATFVIVATCWAADAKYGDAASNVDGASNNVHDAGLYHMKLWDKLWVGSRTSEHGSGNYPGETGVATLYIGIPWVGTDAFGAPRVSGNSPYAAGGAEWYKLLGILWSDGSNWNERPPYINKWGALNSYLMVDDRDATENGPIGLVVEQHGLQWKVALNDDYVMLKYYVRNKSNRNLTNTFFCLYYDFDVGGSLSYIDDKVGVDYGRKMPYMYDEVASHPYVGLRFLDGKPHTLGAPDIMEDPDTDLKKWQLMTSGKWIERETPYDWRVCLSSGPHAVARNQTIQLGCAVIAGANLSELQANADAAYNKYWDIYLGVDKFWARAMPGEVELNWEPNSAYAGFNVYRAAATEPAREVKVNNHLITGHKPFRYVDASVAAGVEYSYELEAVTLNGAKERFGPVKVRARGGIRPAAFSLAQNFPNPARSSTSVAFTLAEPGNATLDVFDLSGRKVATVTKTPCPAGKNAITLDTGKLAAGVYVYRLSSGTCVATKRLAVVK
jgi:hypothetical protein